MTEIPRPEPSSAAHGPLSFRETTWSSTHQLHGLTTSGMQLGGSWDIHTAASGHHPPTLKLCPC